jgi:hypothetical protein
MFRGLFCLSLYCRIYDEQTTCKKKVAVANYVLLLLDVFDPEDGGSALPETSVNLYQTTWRHIAKDSSSHSHLCGNFKSNKTFLLVFFFFIKAEDCCEGCVSMQCLKRA